jgi:transposase
LSKGLSRSPERTSDTEVLFFSLQTSNNPDVVICWTNLKGFVEKFSRAQLLAYTANLPSSLIGLEACAGAHFMGAALREQGHEVRLIPPQFVKPYRKSNKNDFIDGEAIAEAVTQQNIRFVQILICRAA